MTSPSTSTELAGRKALVTGGAQGLGKKFAEYLTAAGATVVIADVQDEKGKEVAESIGGTFVHLDVTDDASWEAAVAQAVSEVGGLDILVNNAGIEIASLFINLDADVARRIFDVNVIGTSLGIKHAFRTMGPGGAAGRSAPRPLRMCARSRRPQSLESSRSSRSRPARALRGNGCGGARARVTAN